MSETNRNGDSFVGAAAEQLMPGGLAVVVQDFSVQYRFPRSKKRRIREKWKKDKRNWRSLTGVCYTISDRLFISRDVLAAILDGEKIPFGGLPCSVCGRTRCEHLQNDAKSVMKRQAKRRGAGQVANFSALYGKRSPGVQFESTVSGNDNHFYRSWMNQEPADQIDPELYMQLEDDLKLLMAENPTPPKPYMGTPHTRPSVFENWFKDAKPKQEDNDPTKTNS